MTAHVGCCNCARTSTRRIMIINSIILLVSIIIPLVWYLTSESHWQSTDTDQKTTSPRKCTKHVLHLGVDGLTPRCMADVAPNIMTRLGDKGMSTLTKARTVLPSISAPGWFTTLCGAKPDSHGVTENTWLPPWQGHKADINPNTPAGEAFPCVFDVIKSQAPNIRTAMFYGWDFFNIIGNGGHPGSVDREYLANYELVGDFKSDEMITDNAIKYLRDVLISAKSSYTFVYLPSVDCVGHEHGWCTESYREAITTMDQHIGRILDVIDELNMEDDVMVMLSSDHGGIDNHHMLRVDADINVPMFIRGPGVKVGQEFKVPVNVADIVPTTIELLGLRASPYWTGRAMKEIWEDDEKSDT